MNEIAPEPASFIEPEFDRLCETCGYNLRGLTENRCPECGTAFVPNLMPLTNIPWLRRDRIGFIKAYVETVVLVTLHPAAFASRFDWPVRINRADGRKFKSLVIWTVVASFIAIPISYIMIESIALRSFPRPSQIVKAAEVIIIMTVFVQIFIRLAAMSLTTRNFPKTHLAEVEDYAAAPFVPFALTIFALMMLTELSGATGKGVNAVDIVAAVLVPVSLLMLWITSACLSASAGCLTRGRAIQMAISLPLHWIGAMTVAGGVAVALAVIITSFAGIIAQF